MKKRLMMLFSICALFMASFSMIHADSSSYVVDEYDVLDYNEENYLNSYASQIESQYGVGFYFALLENVDFSDLNVQNIVGNQEDYLLIAENESSWYAYKGGIVQELLSESECSAIRSAYDAEETYVYGIEACLEKFEQWVKSENISGTAGDDVNPSTDVEYDSDIEYSSDVVRTNAKVYDGADLLSDAEEKALTAQINDIISKYNVDAAIATIDSCGYQSVDSYVEDYYDANNFGIGDTRDGVLLLISMQEREYRILSNGLANAAIPSEDIEKIRDNIVSDLSAGNYAGAFTTFLDECDYEINGEINGFPFPIAENGLIAVVAGLGAAFLTTSGMKGELKSVSKQTKARNYMKKNSMKLTNSNEFFLYRTVSKQRIPQNSGSSSRSGGGSSGSSRSVGGGKF